MAQRKGALQVARARASGAPDQIERQLLGAVLRDPKLLTSLGNLVGAEHFSKAIDERIVDALSRRFSNGLDLSLSQLAQELGQYQWDEGEPAEEYLSSLTDLPFPENGLEMAARQIKDAADARARTSKPYDEDILGWSQKQTRLLAKLSVRDDLDDEIDWANIIEELLSVGRSEISGVARRAELAFVHLIKALSSPDAWSGRAWRNEIELHLLGFQDGYAPSMRRLLNLDRIWSGAKAEAATSLSSFGERLSRELPEKCPFRIEDLVKIKTSEEFVDCYRTNRL